MKLTESNQPAAEGVFLYIKVFKALDFHVFGFNKKVRKARNIDKGSIDFPNL